MALIRQSGAIVVRLDGKAPRVLLVTSKRNRRNWIFPKGHIEKGERAAAAAFREVKEEAGVVARLIGPAGTVEYRVFGAKARAQYFLAVLIREAGPPEDGRKRAWCGLAQALDRLSYKRTRKLLQKTIEQVP